MKVCHNCEESPHLHPRPAGTFCERCRQRVFTVETAMGERFLVGTWTGQRWCPHG